VHLYPVFHPGELIEKILDLVDRVLSKGVVKKKSNGRRHRCSCFAEHYTIDLSEGYPLLTTNGCKRNLSSMKSFGIFQEMTISAIFASRRRSGMHGRTKRKSRDCIRRLLAAISDDAQVNPATGKYEVKEIDQIAEVIHLLKTNPTSRRMVVSAWEPGMRFTANSRRAITRSCSTSREANSTAISRNARATSPSAFRLTLQHILSSLRQLRRKWGSKSGTSNPSHILTNHVSRSWLKYPTSSPTSCAIA